MCGRRSASRPRPGGAAAGSGGRGLRLLLAGVRGLQGLLFVATLADFLDDLRAERGQVVGLTTCHETGVHHYLFVDPLAAGIADVGLERGPRGERAPAHHVGLNATQGPWQMMPTGLPASKKERTKR